jgi:hypothetical protein
LLPVVVFSVVATGDRAGASTEFRVAFFFVGIADKIVVVVAGKLRLWT